MNIAMVSVKEDARKLLIPSDPEAMKSNHLNSIRLLMALLVIWSHSFAIYYGSEENEPVSLLLNGFYDAGKVGVRVFFIISGFLIAWSFMKRRSVLDYFEKRVRRIYPGFLVATAFCTLVVVPSFASGGWAVLSPEILFTSLWKNLLLQGAIPASDAFADNPVQAVNGALWSISYEFWCYIGVAVVGVFGLLHRRDFLIASLIAVLASKTILDLLGRKPGLGIIGDIFGWPYLWTSIAPCFLCGMIVYVLRDRIPRSGWIFSLSFGALFASAHIFGTSRLVFDWIFPLAATYVTFFVAFDTRLPLPDAAKYGDFSYGTYLYGFPIQQMLKAVGGLSFPAYVAASMLFALLGGMASWFLIEKRALKRKNMRSATPRAAW